MADSPAGPAPPNWDSSTPPTDQFINPNPDGNGNVFEIFAVKNGEWHIYPNGQKVWVAGGESNVYQTLASYQAQQAAAATPAPAAPATPAPAPPSSSSSSSSSSDNDQKILQSIELDQKEIEGKISAQNASTTPQQAFQTEAQVMDQVKGLQDQIYSAYESGSLSQTQMQQMETSTISLSVRGIGQEVTSLEKQGGVTAAEQTAVQQQYSELTSNISTLTNRGALPQGAQSDLSQSMGNLETRINALQVASVPTPTTPPTVIIGGGSTGIPGQGNGGTSSSGGTASAGNSSGGTQSGGTSTSTASSSTTSTTTSQSGSAGTDTHTVVAGDTMWSIAESNGMSLKQLEELNPTIKNPELILPGQSINVGGGSAGGMSVGTEVATPLTATADSAVFPKTSSYPSAKEVEIAVKTELSGWTGGTGTEASDPAKNVIEAATKTDTDPLKINNNKTESS